MTREQPQAEWGETESSNPWGETAATGGETGQQATGGSASGHQPNSSSLPDVRSLRLDGSSPVGQQWTQDPQSQSPSSAPPLPRRPLSNQTSFAEPPNLPPRSIFTSQANMQRPSHSSNPRSPRNPFASSSSNPTSARVPFGGDGQPSPAQPFLSSISFTTPSASVGTSTRAIVRSAMEELVKAHHDEIFLRQLKAPAASSPPPHNSPPIPHHYPSEHDAATESFISAFPSLSRSPSPAASAPPAPQAVGSLSSSGGFEEQVQRTTDLLVWQLEQQVEAEVAKGEQGWRGEKARGMQEVEELERELMEESEGRKKAENELKVSASTRDSRTILLIRAHPPCRLCSWLCRRLPCRTIW